MSESIGINLKFEKMKNLGGGFRTEWVSAENDKLEAGLDSGAGLGNPCLTFWIEEKGKRRRYYTADVSELLKKLIELELAVRELTGPHE